MYDPSHFDRSELASSSALERANYPRSGPVIDAVVDLRSDAADDGLTALADTRPNFSPENEFLSNRVDRGPFGTLERKRSFSMA